MDDRHQMFIKGISTEYDNDKMLAFMKKCGAKPLSVSVIRDRESNESRGFAFAEFTSSEEAKKAVGMINGKRLPKSNNDLYATFVDPDRKRGTGRGKGYGKGKTTQSFQAAPDGGAARQA